MNKECEFARLIDENDDWHYECSLGGDCEYGIPDTERCEAYQTEYANTATFDGIVFRTGMDVIILKDSIYHGLSGYISNINKLSNGECEIFLSLETEGKEEELEEIRKRFSLIYEKEVTLEDLNFDNVPISPHLIEPASMCL